MATYLEALVSRWADGPVRASSDGALTLDLLGGGTLALEVRHADADTAVLAATWSAQEQAASGG